MSQHFSPRVVFIKDTVVYPARNFGPNRLYSELSSLRHSLTVNKKNVIYGQVREALSLLELDKENIGTPQWNPFKGLVKPGNHVVLKPNLVIDRHPLGVKGIASMVTHASILAPIIDYVLLATEGKCKITICDVPLQHAVWEKIISATKLDVLKREYEQRGVPIDILDLRKEISVVNKQGIVISRERKIRDPLGYARVNLGSKSEFQEIAHLSEKLTITGYGVNDEGDDLPSAHHNKKKNEYLIAKTILDADFFINVPKLKTHKKTGITCALKNLIGINGDKSWIAHHRIGSKNSGGDEFPEYRLLTHSKYRLYEYLQKGSIRRMIGSFLVAAYVLLRYGGRSRKNQHVLQSKRLDIVEGSWSGNDTLWRSIKDLNKIIFYADKQGKMQKIPQRKYLCITDAIISGEGEGPMMQLPKRTGIIAAATNPVYMDVACAEYVMGFNWKNIPMISESFSNKWWPLVKQKKPQVISNVSKKKLLQKFKPPFNWREALI